MTRGLALLAAASVCAVEYSPMGAAPTKPPSKKALDAYQKLLRKELLLSLPGANLSIGAEGVYAQTDMPPRALALSIPSKYVLTVQEALGSGVGSYINKRSRELPRTIPRHFILAMWVLFEKHMVGPRSRGLWHAWIDTLPPLDNCTYFWSEAELELLEEERALKKTYARRRKLEEEFHSLVRVLLAGGLQDELPDGVQIALADYAWAIHVVTRYALHLAWDFPILVPLSFRLHPIAASELLEFGEQSDPSIALYVAPEGVRKGAEFTVPYEDGAFNEDLLLHAGYVWDELAATRPRLMLSEGTRDLALPIERRRRRLRDAANWSSPMDFEQSSDELNAEMLAWLRLSFANAAELDAIVAAREDCSAPLSPYGHSDTEDQVVRALLATIDQQLSRYDHSVEEDEHILEHSRRTGKKLSPRAEIAVTYRKLSKQVLQRTASMAREHFKAYQQRRLPHGVRKSGAIGRQESADHGQVHELEPVEKKAKRKRKKRRKTGKPHNKDEL
ncbi:hypothetical protein AB1Y20_004033 [Prymnesium parvum]|uniref:Rubisco LSMT substrate-binding domain-containing protein n=1 Tax=Prymnesium parvum TaxID=97485 RepID=A0AB34J698_PRYPA